MEGPHIIRIARKVLPLSALADQITVRCLWLLGAGFEDVEKWINLLCHANRLHSGLILQTPYT